MALGKTLVIYHFQGTASGRLCRLGGTARVPRLLLGLRQALVKAGGVHVGVRVPGDAWGLNGVATGGIFRVLRFWRLVCGALGRGRGVLAGTGGTRGTGAGRGATGHAGDHLRGDKLRCWLGGSCWGLWGGLGLALDVCGGWRGT